jgi:hypothetical protein
MIPERVTVLGGGNTAFSLAANLALAGHQVLLWEHPAFAWTIAPIRDSLTIHLEGAAQTGPARLAAVTTDPAEALAWSDTLVCSVPSYAHGPFIEQLVPHLRPGHLLALLPGNLGTLAFARALREGGVTGVILAEADTAPYVCRKLAPDRAVIWGTVTGLGIGVFPASQTAEALPALQALFPGATAYASVLVTGLSAMNPVVHPPGVLLNAGRIERSRGEFWFYEEGVTPAVVRAIEALDAERLAIGRAFGLELIPVATAPGRFRPAGRPVERHQWLRHAHRAPRAWQRQHALADGGRALRAGDVGGPRGAGRCRDAGDRRDHHPDVGRARPRLPGARAASDRFGPGGEDPGGDRGVPGALVRGSGFGVRGRPGPQGPGSTDEAPPGLIRHRGARDQFRRPCSGHVPRGGQGVRAVPSPPSAFVLARQAGHVPATIGHPLADGAHRRATTGSRHVSTAIAPA